jgi:uncharacterized protein (TIGR03086 family)
MTYDWLDLQIRAHSEFGRRLDAVTDWHGATPDTDWDVATLAKHVIREQQWVKPLLAGKSIEDARGELEPLGDDLIAEWARYSAEATEAWACAPSGASVHLSRDTVEVADYLKEQVSDVTIHSWDLARATGSDEHLDDELVAATWTIFEPQRETLAATGLFSDPIDLDEDAPLQLRLLAITGRDARPAAA